MNLAPSPVAPRAAPNATIRVFVAEDHAITLWGLQRLIDAMQPRMTVVGTAATRDQLLNHTAVGEADVVLLDLDLAGECMADSLADLQRRCGGQVLVLTGADDLDQHRDVVVKGARGVLHKSEPAQTILQAIEKVHGGEIWLNRNLLGKVLGQLTGSRSAAKPKDPNAERIASLTPREREIIATMVRLSGAKQLAVADALAMSEHTLRNHLTTIYSKLAVHGRLELHLFATEYGLGGSCGPRPTPLTDMVRREGELTEWLLRGFALLIYGLAVSNLAQAWWRDPPRLTLLLLLLTEGYTFALVLIARRASARDLTPLSVAATGYAAFFFVLFDAQGTVRVASEFTGVALQVVGLAWQFASKYTLGRSFGLLPAARRIVVAGPYRVVRHPIYLGYLVSHIGFLLVNFSWRNLAVIAVLYAAQALRIHREEQVLRSDNDYRLYVERVRWRLLPGVF